MTRERVEIHLGALCNNKCVFCMSAQARDDRHPWADFEVVKRELEHFRVRGCRAVGFLGGEPTVYPRIEECVAYAKSLGYERIALCSNGMRFSDAAFGRRLAEAGMTRVTVSVHSHLAEIEDDRITLIPGNWARKVAGLRHLLALRDGGFLKDNVSLNPVLCRPTLAHMEDYLRCFSAMGVRDVRFNYIWPEGAAREDRGWIPSFREAAPHMVRAMALNETRLRLRLSFGGVPRCVLGLTPLSPGAREHFARRYLDEGAFDPPNDVTIASRGTAVKSPPRFVWQERKADELKVREDSCRGCRHYAACEGVWRSYVKLYGFAEFRPWS